MTELWVSLAYFVLAATADIASIRWHRHRESGEALKAANTAVWIGALAWAPFVLVLTMGSWWPIVADLAGGWVGSYLGVRRGVREEA